MASAQNLNHLGTPRNPLLLSVYTDMSRMEHERLVVRLPKRQKDWLKQQATEFKTISDVVRDLIDRQIENTSASRDKA